jgi:hypothetical protein
VRIHRFTIAWLLVAIAVIAFPMALLSVVMNDRPRIDRTGTLDMGLWLTIPVLTVYLFAAIRRRAMIRAFDFGFLAFGWAAAFVFVVTAWACPGFMHIPIVFYINEIEPYFLDCDLTECYILSLLIQGAIFAIPQLVVALLGGLVVRRFESQGVVNQSSGREV